MWHIYWLCLEGHLVTRCGRKGVGCKAPSTHYMFQHTLIIIPHYFLVNNLSVCLTQSQWNINNFTCLKTERAIRNAAYQTMSTAEAKNLCLLLSIMRHHD